MTPARGSSHASHGTDPLACTGCGQLLYADQPMVSHEIDRASHIGCHMLAAIQLRHGSGVLLGETLPPLVS
jgi:TPP-dependent indolepyruvate ferredoxin oxidoreductase alpha subunit